MGNAETGPVEGVLGVGYPLEEMGTLSQRPAVGHRFAEDYSANGRRLETTSPTTQGARSPGPTAGGEGRDRRGSSDDRPAPLLRPDALGTGGTPILKERFFPSA